MRRKMNCTPERSTNAKIPHLGRLLAAGLVAGACGSGRAASTSAAQAVAPAMWADVSTPSRQHFKSDNVHSTPSPSVEKFFLVLRSLSLQPINMNSVEPQEYECPPLPRAAPFISLLEPRLVSLDGSGRSAQTRGRGSRRRAGPLAGDSSMAVCGEVQCEGDKAFSCP